MFPFWTIRPVAHNPGPSGYHAGDHAKETTMPTFLCLCLSLVLATSASAADPPDAAAKRAYEKNRVDVGCDYLLFSVYAGDLARERGVPW